MKQKKDGRKNEFLGLVLGHGLRGLAFLQGEIFTVGVNSQKRTEGRMSFWGWFWGLISREGFKQGKIFTSGLNSLAQTKY